MVCRLTTAQAIIQFLKVQYSARDGREQQLFGRCFGIFGHGNVAGNRAGIAGKPGLPLLRVSRYWDRIQRHEQILAATDLQACPY